MPLYEYRCQTCDDVFELRKSFDDADAVTECPAGHAGVVRLLPVFASVGRAGASASASPAPSASAGPCGGGCACYPG